MSEVQPLAVTTQQESVENTTQNLGLEVRKTANEAIISKLYVHEIR